MTKKKRIFIICGFCLLLAVTGVLNIVLNNQVAKANNDNVTTTGNFFTNYMQDRQSTFERDQLYLNAIISNTNVSAEAKAAAEAELLNMITTMRLQEKLEGQMTAKGFSNVAVSALAKTISVIVKSSERLTDNEVAQIVEIIQSSTSYDFENIKIIPVE